MSSKAADSSADTRAALRFRSPRNNRTATNFNSKDDLFSPRLALVYKPVEPLSLYASYSLTYQPRAGDQLSSLSATNESLDPEEFENFEIGAKWDALSNLALTAAVFRLERSNVAIPDPADPINRSILVDGQRNQGIELGATGYVTEQWSILGAYTYQQQPAAITALVIIAVASFAAEWLYRRWTGRVIKDAA